MLTSQALAAHWVDLPQLALMAQPVLYWCEGCLLLLCCGVFCARALSLQSCSSMIAAAFFSPCIRLLRVLIVVSCLVRRIYRAHQRLVRECKVGFRCCLWPLFICYEIFSSVTLVTEKDISAVEDEVVDVAVCWVDGLCGCTEWLTVDLDEASCIKA